MKLLMQFSFSELFLNLNTNNKAKCCDARIVLTMPSRITFMLFVPMRGGIAHAMRASGLIIIRTLTKSKFNKNFQTVRQEDSKFKI